MYSTYLGGSGSDEGKGIAVDGSGNAYVTGRTGSSNFPTQSALQSTHGGGGDDAYVLVLTSGGSSLVYSTYLGGSGSDVGRAIALDGSGNTYITGQTFSSNFPTQSALQSTHGGSWDVFVSVLTSGGSSLVYSTYLGGSSGDRGYGIAADGSGNAYVTGLTGSPNFPIQSAFQAIPGNGQDGFVLVLTSGGSSLVYSTYLGGSGSDQGNGIAVDGSGNAYVTGQTASADFPTQSALQAIHGGGYDVFVSVFNSGGAALMSTYLGGSGSDEGKGIAVDGSDNAYITGQTVSTGFPIQSAFQAIHGGGNDVFVVKVADVMAPLPVSVGLPAATATYNQSMSLPLAASSTDGHDIVAYEFELSFDSSLLINVVAQTTGTLSDGWSLEQNTFDGVGTTKILKVAAANNAALSGVGILLDITFTVADVRAPASSPLDLEAVVFNTGDVATLVTDGSVTLVGVDGSTASAPVEIIPRDDITVTIDDADEDRDGNNPDSFDVRVTNGTQTETLTVTETGDATGLFEGTISTAFSLGSTSGDGIVQAQAGDLIEFCYDDSLDATGGTVERCTTTDVIGGTDGSVAITLVSQPGDPLYIQVVDADLNVSFSSAETVSVTIENSRTAESFTLVLTEADVDDEVFFAGIPTTAGASTATVIGTAEDDVVTVTYDDVVTGVGDQQDRAATDEVIDPWGDADDNESLQAFDAAQVLLDVLSGGTLLSGVSRLSADVADPFAAVTPFDASFILQKRVGLIASFPAQDPASANHPQGDPVSPKRVVEQRWLTLVPGEGYVSVVADDRSGILTGDLLLEGIGGRVEMGAELGSFLQASQRTDERLRVVFAGAQEVNGPGELLRVAGVGPGDARLTRATFNDGRIIARMDPAVVRSMPSQFALLPNAPNPFNPETTIRFALPVESAVTLEVFDALGQRVRTLVAEVRPAGMHQAVWDGRNEVGVQAGNGVYFYRLRAGDWRSDASRPADLRFEQMSRMLLLK